MKPETKVKKKKDKIMSSVKAMFQADPPPMPPEPPPAPPERITVPSSALRHPRLLAHSRHRRIIGAGLVAALFSLQPSAFILPCLAQPSIMTAPATQTEVNDGVLRYKYVSPATLANYNLLQATNGISASQSTNIAWVAATNAGSSAYYSNIVAQAAATNTISRNFYSNYIANLNGLPYVETNELRQVFFNDTITMVDANLKVNQSGNISIDGAGIFYGNGAGLTNLNIAPSTNAVGTTIITNIANWAVTNNPTNLAFQTNMINNVATNSSVVNSYWSTFITNSINAIGAAGRQIYVSPWGNDTTGQGTIANPFKTVHTMTDIGLGTFQGANTIATNVGDTVVLTPGIHLAAVIPLRDGVNLWLMPGTTLIRHDITNGALFGVSPYTNIATLNNLGPLIQPGHGSVIDYRDATVIATNIGVGDPYNAVIGWFERIPQTNAFNNFNFGAHAATNVIVHPGVSIGTSDNFYFVQTNKWQSSIYIYGGRIRSGWDSFRAFSNVVVNTFYMDVFSTNTASPGGGTSQAIAIDGGAQLFDHISTFGSGGGTNNFPLTAATGVRVQLDSTRLYRTSGAGEDIYLQDASVILTGFAILSNSPTALVQSQFQGSGGGLSNSVDIASVFGGGITLTTNALRTYTMSITNLNGAAIAAATINSNAFDPSTFLLLTNGGGGSGTTYTNNGNPAGFITGSGIGTNQNVNALTNYDTRKVIFQNTLTSGTLFAITNNTTNVFSIAQNTRWLGGGNQYFSDNGTFAPIVGTYYTGYLTNGDGLLMVDGVLGFLYNREGGGSQATVQWIACQLYSPDAQLIMDWNNANVFGGTYIASAQNNNWIVLSNNASAIAMNGNVNLNNNLQVAGDATVSGALNYPILTNAAVVTVNTTIYITNNGRVFRFRAELVP